jgi:pimeloyl-ACP methyl ester carboxylesterase
LPVEKGVSMRSQVGQDLVMVRSRDGTDIACYRTGAGSPLVLVHGTTADHTRWAPVLPALSQRFTVYAMDRRGRGGSGDTEPYALEREFEDLVAVVESRGESVNLLGHSYGGMIALEAATRTHNIRRLIVYEGAAFPEEAGVDIYPPGSIEGIEALLRAGDRDGAVTAMMGEIAGLSPDQVEFLKTLPAWRARVEAADTIPRELRADRDYRPNRERLSRLRTPTLFLLGGDSPSFYRITTESLADALPDARIAVMPGQQHAAMDTGPDVFLAEVLRFLDE